MLKRVVLPIVLVALATGIPALGVGCGKPKQKMTGPLKDWILGNWARQDDPNWWVFGPNGEMTTTGRVPIGGSYQVEEPNKVEVTISGAGAYSASTMLGVPLNPENKNLYLHFIVEDDEMRPAGIKSETVFRKK
ncbi:MAG TPA: hypothetical protein VKW04_23835 [Planctomycetota bacterium]|nr:hypothetical protein [Planctomycetota bacterium]